MFRDARVRILVALRDAGHARSIATQLDQLGILAQTAENGPAAIAKFGQGDFQVVIVDINDPAGIMEPLAMIAPETVFITFSNDRQNQTAVKPPWENSVWGSLSTTDSPDRFKQTIKTAVDKSMDLKHAAVRRGFLNAVFLSAIFWILVGLIFLVYRWVR